MQGQKAECGGGTGGHIYPALAIINKIKEKEPNSEFLYIGTHNRMEKDIVPKYNIPFKTVEIYGFNRKNLLKNFKTIKCLLTAKSKCKKMIKEFNPDIVIGVGGYVTVPVIMAALCVIPANGKRICLVRIPISGSAACRPTVWMWRNWQNSAGWTLPGNRRNCIC